MQKNDKPEFRPIETKLKFMVVTFTPDLSRWLTDHSRILNRDYRKPHLSALRSAMEQGSWVLNGLPIILAEDLSIVDGHHRLEASAKFGLSFTSVCIIGIDKDAMDTIDAGAKRSLADVIVIQRPNLRDIAPLTESTLRRVLTYAFRENVPPFCRTTQQCLRYASADPAFLDVVREFSGKKVSGPLSVSQIAALTYIGRIADRPATNEYVHGVVSGELIKDGMPAYVVRTRLLEAREASRAGLLMTQRVKFNLFCTGLVWRMQNKTVTKLGKWKFLPVPGAEPEVIRERLGISLPVAADRTESAA